jgi:hypothetical protein
MRTDRRRDKTKLIVAFRNFVSAPKIVKKLCLRFRFLIQWLFKTTTFMLMSTYPRWNLKVWGLQPSPLTCLQIWDHLKLMLQTSQKRIFFHGHKHSWTLMPRSDVRITTLKTFHISFNYYSSKQRMYTILLESKYYKSCLTFSACSYTHKKVKQLFFTVVCSLKRGPKHVAAGVL